MPEVLRRGMRGRRGDALWQEIVDLQDDLNKLGAMLAYDGDFGAGTELAVREARQAAGLDDGDAADKALRDWLRQRPWPAQGQLAPASATMIAREEVTDRRRYEVEHCRPSWPEVDSGLTIGVGYDLGYASAAQFAADWRDRLPANALATLAPHVGKKGQAAKMAAELPDVRALRIPLPEAWDVFVRRSVPRFFGLTQSAFGEIAPLPEPCRAALVSLIYNRGSGLDGDRRVEMRRIRDLLAADRTGEIPEQFEAMVRLWPDTKGLRIRRRREAALFRHGLNGSESKTFVPPPEGE
jgi:hypothetical protein